MENRPVVAVLGSVHMDLIAAAPSLPGAGESVRDGTFTMAPGGKAGYQAVACARAGGRTRVIARLGNDDFGEALRKAMRGEGVDTTMIAVDTDVPTGASTIFSSEGDYCSIIAPGAAARLSPADLERSRPTIASAHALILQLELPPATSAAAATFAAEARHAVILNASPEPDIEQIPEALRQATSTVIVNKVEAERLLKHSIELDGLASACRELAAIFDARDSLITLGPDGAAGIIDGAFSQQKAFEAEVVDPVGAGDSFLGAFVVARLAGKSPDESLRRGLAAGAIAVSRTGGYTAPPTEAEVDAYLAERA